VGPAETTCVAPVTGRDRGAGEACSRCTDDRGGGDPAVSLSRASPRDGTPREDQPHDDEPVSGPDRAATVQAALCRLQRAKRGSTREPHERRGGRGLMLDEVGLLLAKAAA
jgi:hypothetical protein